MTAAIFAQPFQLVGCQSCRDKTQLPFEFAMAFQPIMDLEMDRPFACEALVRGVDGESAGPVLSWVDYSNGTGLTRPAGSRPSNWPPCLDAA